jgi:hypothetical protein
VCNQGKSVLFIAKRRIDSTVDQFKCHGFEAASQATAKSLASHIVSTCNSVFRKLRRKWWSQPRFFFICTLTSQKKCR